jgi:hypothetical protein
MHHAIRGELAQHVQRDLERRHEASAFEPLGGAGIAEELDGAVDHREDRPAHRDHAGPGG